MEGENRNDRGDRESYRRKPGESKEGLIAAHDLSETPGGNSDRGEQDASGCDLGHGCMLSGSLEHWIVKN
jgi:hypothetical protein